MGRWVFLLCVAFLLAGCSAASQKRQPLDYVGQVQFGQPAVRGGEVLIPVTYVGGKWNENSSVVPYKIDSRVVDSRIEITVITAIATGKADPDRNGYEIRLPAGTQGKYTVVYVDPNGTRHELQAVDLPK